MPDLPTLLTIQQVAEQLNVSVETIRRNLRARRLGCYRLQGCIRISPEQVADFLASCLAPAAPAAAMAQAVEQPRREATVEAFQRNRGMERALAPRRAGRS